VVGVEKRGISIRLGSKEESDANRSKGGKSAGLAYRKASCDPVREEKKRRSRFKEKKITRDQSASTMKER